ncbi:MAG TPA: ornithine cyclodeaminase family protein [Bryobacteraceae bacterium]|nr:ornithine cyclodeaminase family protein [Bryobacteraceae bacterium]
MLYFTEDDVRRLLPMNTAIGLMREVFADLKAGRAQNQPRRRLVTPSGVVLHQLAGATPKYLGTKTYSTSRSGAWFLVTLYSAEDGKPLAMLEANWLGRIRTGAVTGYATDVMARPDARTAGVIGAGFQARSQIEALLAVRRLEQVHVWSRSEERRRALAAEFGEPVEAVATAEEAVRNADIVVTATNAREPVLDSAWVKPGAHVNAIGSNQAKRREIPADLVHRASLIATDSLEQARMESGDLLLSLDEQGWERVLELQNVEVRPHNPGAITIFKSNGLGVEDVAAAGYLFEQGIERRLPLFYS